MWFKEIHQVNDPEKGGGDKWSLSRLALSLSLVFYLITTIIMLIGSLGNFDLDQELMIEILSGLRWPIGLFAGYAWGGKFLKSKVKNDK